MRRYLLEVLSGNRAVGMHITNLGPVTANGPDNIVAQPIEGA